MEQHSHSKERQDVKQSVLIVDDDSRLGDSMGLVFRRTGYRVTVCTSGYAALERTGEDCFDIIITDHQMPVMNGLELTRQLRRREVKATIIGMSCYEASEEFHRAGADGFFRKPLMPEVLQDIVSRRVDA